MKSKMANLCGMVILSIALVTMFGGCKNFGIPDYDLKVTMEDGVQGVPTAGTYSYRELTAVTYSYAPLNGDHTAEVLINGTRKDIAGTITMYNHTEVVVRVFDIRGEWSVTMQKPLDSNGNTQDPITFKLTFTGTNLLSGEFTDDRGYRGLWTITGQTLTINYNDWENYVLTGTIPTMTGTWTGETLTASWRAVR